MINGFKRIMDNMKYYAKSTKQITINSAVFKHYACLDYTKHHLN